MKIEDVEGIGPAFAEKLTAAGVATTDWIRQIPGETTIAGWIEQAAHMDKVVSH